VCHDVLCMSRCIMYVMMYYVCHDVLYIYIS